MQFSRLASLSVKRLLIPGTIFVIYTQTAHCENNKVKLLCWGGKKPLDIHFRKSHLKLTNEIKEVALSTEFEAVITGEGKVRIRNNMEGEYKAIGSFGEGGWFSSSPKAKKISAYDSQLYVIDEEGKLWRKKDVTFEEVDFPEKAREVVVQKDRVAVVSKTGYVYMNGENQFGQCGLGRVLNTNGKFVMIDKKFFDSHVEEVALGDRHTLFRTRLGRVYSCGANDHMQLGLPWTREMCYLAGEDWFQMAEKSAESQIGILETHKAQRSYYDVKTAEYRPRVLIGKVFDGYCRKIAAGEKHSIALIGPTQRSPPNVYTWGAGMRGQLGHRNIVNMSEPGCVSMVNNFSEYDDEDHVMKSCIPTQISSGANHFMIMVSGPSTKMVFIVGDNTDKQITQMPQRKYSQPVWIKKLAPLNGLQPSKIFAGQNKSSVMCECVENYSGMYKNATLSD